MIFLVLIKKITSVLQSKWQRDVVTVHPFFKSISFSHNDSAGGAKLVKALWGFELDNANFQRFLGKLKASENIVQSFAFISTAE